MRTKKTSALSRRSACAVKKRSVFALKKKCDFLRSRSDRESLMKQNRPEKKRKILRLTMKKLTSRGGKKKRKKRAEKLSLRRSAGLSSRQLLLPE